MSVGLPVRQIKGTNEHSLEKKKKKSICERLNYKGLVLERIPQEKNSKLILITQILSDFCGRS